MRTIDLGETQPRWWFKGADLLDYAEHQPPPRRIVGPLVEGTWGILAAPPGVGKSMLSLALAASVGTGRGLAHWEAGEMGPRGAFVADVELSVRTVAERMLSLAKRDDWDSVGIYTNEKAELCHLPLFNLADPDWQDRLMTLCDEQMVRFVVIDNVSFALNPIRVGDLHSPETWNQVVPVLNWARNTGKCLLFVDHTNKEGKVAGSLQKIRGADFVLFLRETETRSEDQLAFILEPAKWRYQVEQIHRGQHRMAYDLDGHWYSEPVQSRKEQVQELKRCGAKPKEIAEELGISLATVYRHLEGDS